MSGGNKVQAFRGSRKHLLDFLSSGSAPESLTGLLADANVVVEHSHRVRPVSHSDSAEWDLRRFCRDCAPNGVDLRGIDEWWATEEYRGPTWDLLAECTIQGTAGFLLVEAKAHESELQRQGKPVSEDPSPQSKANQERIEASLARTQAWFRSSVSPNCRIHAHSHYQLSNRLSAAEALASCGVHVVLLYLGFTGDRYFTDDYLRDDLHWQRIMGAYLDGVVPLWWPGRTAKNTAAGSVTMLIRSLPVQEVSTRHPALA